MNNRKVDFNMIVLDLGFLLFCFMELSRGLVYFVLSPTGRISLVPALPLEGFALTVVIYAAVGLYYWGYIGWKGVFPLFSMAALQEITWNAQYFLSHQWLVGIGLTALIWLFYVFLMFFSFSMWPDLRPNLKIILSWKTLIFPAYFGVYYSPLFPPFFFPAQMLYVFMIVYSFTQTVKVSK